MRLASDSEYLGRHCGMMEVHCHRTEGQDFEAAWYTTPTPRTAGLGQRRKGVYLIRQARCMLA